MSGPKIGTKKVAAIARLSEPTVRRYADAGWIKCVKDANGRRLYTMQAALALAAQRATVSQK